MVEDIRAAFTAAKINGVKRDYFPESMSFRYKVMDRIDR
jgi:hypothetical protein